jgi:hypothetical protein
MPPWFGDALRLPQRNDIGRRFLDDAEAIEFQLTDYRRLSRAGSAGQYEPCHATPQKCDSNVAGLSVAKTR